MRFDREGNQSRRLTMLLGRRRQSKSFTQVADQTSVSRYWVGPIQLSKSWWHRKTKFGIKILHLSKRLFKLLREIVNLWLFRLTCLDIQRPVITLEQIREWNYKVLSNTNPCIIQQLYDLHFLVSSDKRFINDVHTLHWYHWISLWIIYWGLVRIEIYCQLELRRGYGMDNGITSHLLSYDIWFW